MMTARPSHARAYVDYLETLRQRSTSRQRAAWVALKHGLPNPLDAVHAAPMVEYITPWIKRKDSSRWWGDVHYIIASLYTLHPVSTDMGCMGDHLRELFSGDPSNSQKARVNLLLGANRALLYVVLKPFISPLAQAEIPINWSSLLYDLAAWPDTTNRNRITKKWAAAFFSSAQPTEQTQQGDN